MRIGAYLQPFASRKPVGELMSGEIDIMLSPGLPFAYTIFAHDMKGNFVAGGGENFGFVFDGIGDSYTGRFVRRTANLHI